MQISVTTWLAVLVISSSSCRSSALTSSLPTKRTILHSQFVKDSFDIYVTLPAGYDSSSKSFPVIFYMDANLKSGNSLRNIINEFNKQNQPINAVFVGLGHIGNYHSLRRRDFITPYVKDENDSLTSGDKNYGQCENFYLFLEKELIPYIERNYKVNSSRTVVGHSLGGLFTFYCLFKKERLFNNFIALSPALWINHENIYDFERKYWADGPTLHGSLYLCVGGAERLNYILPGARKMKAYLEKAAPQDLQIEYYEFAGETHNSEVPIALTKILPRLKLK